MQKLARNSFRVKIFEKVMKFASALQKIPAKTTPPPFRLMQIGSLFWQSRALYVATKLGLADVIGNEQKSTKEIAAALQLDEKHLYRLMRMLGSMDIFEEISPRVFRNSDTSAFLRADNPQNICAMILMHNSPEMTKPWMEPLEQSIRDGEVPFIKAHGSDLFSYMDQHKEFDLLFSQAMDVIENITGNEFLNDFDWGAFERIIDVGGSKGSKSISVLKAWPNLRAIVFDRPQIIDAARADCNQHLAPELCSRIEFQPGNMFTSLPVARSDKDLYVFFGIFHSLNDEESNAVLESLRTAIGTKQASALIVDCVAEENHINSTIAAFDMQMLIGTRGRERTANEWRAVIESAGFNVRVIIDVRTFVKFIVVSPASRDN